jgi:plasmid stability protein
MATITLKNIPERLHRSLKKRASAHKRSLNQEALLCLEAVVGAQDVRSTDFLAHLDALHASLPSVTLDDAWLRRAKEEGRP